MDHLDANGEPTWEHPFSYYFYWARKLARRAVRRGRDLGMAKHQARWNMVARCCRLGHDIAQALKLFNQGWASA